MSINQINVMTVPLDQLLTAASDSPQSLSGVVIPVLERLGNAMNAVRQTTYSWGGRAAVFAG